MRVPLAEIVSELEATSTLTAEEAFLWDCARGWRNPTPPDRPGRLDWERVVAVGAANRMQTLLNLVCEATALKPLLTPQASQALTEGAARNERLSQIFGRDLRLYLHHAAQIGQEVVVLKGLWLSQEIYGVASMRPGGDIDILLREHEIPDSLRILEEEMDYGRWWRPLLDDRYYTRHHLHQQRCNYNRSIWFEPHWMLDHPYTRLTVDYEGLMDRTKPGELFGEPVQELSLPELLLSLSIHLVKHAVYLPSTLDRPDLQRLILADAKLMYFLDVAEVVKQHAGEIDWPFTVKLAGQWGADEILGSVLQVCHDCLASPVPDGVLAALTVRGTDRLTNKIMNQLANSCLASYLGLETGKLWAFLLGYNEAIIFRPIRLLDLVHFAFPGSDYLQRRYGRSGALTAAHHLLRATAQYIRIAVDTLYFTWKRNRRVDELDRQGFEWPEPPLA